MATMRADGCPRVNKAGCRPGQGLLDPGVGPLRRRGGWASEIPARVPRSVARPSGVGHARPGDAARLFVGEAGVPGKLRHRQLEGVPRGRTAAW